MSDAHHDEIVKLEALYAENPEGRVFTHLAEACRKAGELERAREVLAEGIERHPDYSSAHVVLGRVLMDLGDNDAARTEFRRVLELDHQNLVALRSLGDIARAEGRTEDALEHYHALLDLEPADAEVRDLVETLSEGLVVPGPAGTEAGEPEPGPPDALPGLPESDDELPGLPESDDELPGLPGLPEPADELPGLPDDEDLEGADVMTETIAQVYARQGLYERAVEVYEELIRARPEDEGLKERLAALREEAAGDEWAEEQPWEPGEAVAEDSDEGLAGIEVEESPEELTPDDEGPVAGFQSVEFEGDEADVDAAPLEGLEVEEPEADAAPWLAEEPTEPELEPEPETWDPADALSEEPVAEEPVAEEPVVEEPASPWTEAVDVTETEAETPYTWAAAEETADASPPIGSYLKGLLDFGEGVPAPVEPEAPAELREAVEPGPASEAPDAPDAEDAEDDEDADLEMFRSWLESLKQ